MINKEELMNRILLLEPDLTQALLELISDYELKMIKLEKQDKILEILKRNKSISLTKTNKQIENGFSSIYVPSDEDEEVYKVNDKEISQEEFDLLKEAFKDDK